MSLSLTLPQEMLLLALHDEKGTVAFGSMLGYGLAGAVLTELILRERIAVESEGRKATPRVTDPSGTGDALLDDALARVGEEKTRTLQSWVGRLAVDGKERQTLALGLARRGILRATEEEILLFFRRKVYPTVDPGPERELVARVRRAILEPEEPMDERTALLVGLLSATSLLKPVLDRKERKASRDRIEELAKGGQAGPATREAVQAAMAATTAAVTAAITAANVAATS